MNVKAPMPEDIFIYDTDAYSFDVLHRFPWPEYVSSCKNAVTPYAIVESSTSHQVYEFVRINIPGSFSSFTNVINDIPIEAKKIF